MLALKAMREFRSHNIRPLTVFLMLALLLAAFMPAGFMPGRDADGKAALVICTAMGQQTVWVDAGQVPVKPGNEPAQHGHRDGACAFAPLVSYDMPVVNRDVLPLVFAAISLPGRLVAPAPAQYERKPWFAQGPPVFSS